MPDLNSLGLNESSAPQVDWDAPEAGKTPPAAFPGRYIFLFKLPESKDDWFDQVEREVVRNQPTSKRKFLELTCIPDIIAAIMPDGSQQPILNPETNERISLGPQRFNMYMNPKMSIHRLAELLRSCGVREERNLLAKTEGGVYVIDELVTALNGNATFDGEGIWRTYFKSTSTTISTHPRKKAGELAWPRNAQGEYELLATNPQTGEKAFGYFEITGLHTPTQSSAPTETMASAAS